MRIYFAGPLFTTSEREWNSKLASILTTKGLNIYLPQDHEPKVLTPSNMFNICTQAIDESDVVIAIMDGPDPDSGTCFECGYAFAKNKKIFTIRTDFRKAGDLGTDFNLMLTESSTVIHMSSLMPTTEEVATALLNHLLDHNA